MDRYQIKLDTLLDLFDSGHKNAYVSVMDVFNGDGLNITRLEIFLQNVGTLRLYQSFIENFDGEQFPSFVVFYTDATNSNIHTKITDKQLLNKAISIVYKTKKYMENNPDASIKNNTEIISKTRHNTALALKLYEKHLKKRMPFFQMIYRGK